MNDDSQDEKRSLVVTKDGHDDVKRFVKMIIFCHVIVNILYVTGTGGSILKGSQPPSPVILFPVQDSLYFSVNKDQVFAQQGFIRQL